VNLQQSFKNLADSDKLSHAYLFFGSPDLNFVRCLANFLENKKWSKSTIPLVDYLEVEASGIDDIRSVQKFLWRAPVKSQRRLAAIVQADNLTAEAQNAILKIAEEPPSRALLVLMVKDPELLTPALVSRFQKIYLIQKQVAPTNEVTKKFLLANHRERSAIIREAASDNQQLEELVRGVMGELSKNSVENFKPLKELCYRWSLIGRYNTNKRLQLEAWLESFNF